MRTKYRKLATLLTLVGFIMVAVAVGYSIFELQSLRAQVKQKKKKSDSLNLKIEELKKTIDSIKNGPISELITPKAIAVKLEGKKDIEGRQLFNFILWIDLPNFRKKDIRYVKYNFDHPTMLKKERIGNEPSNGFAVNYTGWGCLSLVKLTIVQQDQSVVKLDFYMCNEIIIQ